MFGYCATESSASSTFAGFTENCNIGAARVRADLPMSRLEKYGEFVRIFGAL
jgi:squalene cyclase